MEGPARIRRADREAVRRGRIACRCRERGWRSPDRRSAKSMQNIAEHSQTSWKCQIQAPRRTNTLFQFTESHCRHFQKSSRLFLGLSRSPLCVPSTTPGSAVGANRLCTGHAPIQRAHVGRAGRYRGRRPRPRPRGRESLRPRLAVRPRRKALCRPRTLPGMHRYGAFLLLAGRVRRDETTSARSF